MRGVPDLDSGTVDTAAPAGGAALRSDDALVGRLLDGRYRLQTLIARGGMATVYRATDLRLDRVVAVKVPHTAFAEHPEFVERFTREARAAAALHSPDVVAVHDQGRDPATGLPYLVMEHVDGHTLRDVLRSRGALPPAEALRVLEPVLRALAAAHAAGTVHRDVKPENVLVADDGDGGVRVKVADFGLARAVTSVSVTRTLIGTVAYLAPEQVENGTADPRSDVYSAGIVLFELLTGTPPYCSDSVMTVMYRHVHDDVPPPSSAVPGIPAAVDDLVRRATRRDPAARPLDAGAFLAEVRAVLADLPADLPPGRTTVLATGSGLQHTLLVDPADPALRRPARPARLQRSRRRLIWTLVVSVLAAGALAGGWYLGSGRYAGVPDVVRADPAVATTTLRNAGFRVQIDSTGQFSEDIPAGTVAVERPGAGTRTTKGSLVTLVLSRGPDRRAVPDVAGKDVAAATAALRAVGLSVGTTAQQFSDQPPGVVVGTDPAAGTRLRPDAAVTLLVSKGQEMLAVPSVVKLPQDQAVKALGDAGFTADVQLVFSDAAKGTVVAQNPAQGKAPRGSAVTLQVSKGPDLVTVPDVRSMPKAQAEAALTAAGLAVRWFDIPGGPGRVLSTQPGAGAQAKRGSTVTGYVF